MGDIEKDVKEQKDKKSSKEKWFTLAFFIVFIGSIAAVLLANMKA